MSDATAFGVAFLLGVMFAIGFIMGRSSRPVPRRSVFSSALSAAQAARRQRIYDERREFWRTGTMPEGRTRPPSDDFN